MEVGYVLSGHPVHLTFIMRINIIKIFILTLFKAFSSCKELQ